MPVKILHCADMHLDSPFEALPGELAKIRRSEQRKLIERIAEIAEKEAADIVLMAGDLFDSASTYCETRETLINTLGTVNAKVFIAPGNHDYCCHDSPYLTMALPANVHVFTRSEIECVELPELGCRVYGAGFTRMHAPALLRSFCASHDSAVNIMVLHGDTSGGEYGPISEDEIASSGLDYLALGHVHAYSGVLRAGNTFYAYPGCTEGRGFDETGDKGVIVGEVSKGAVSLSFCPLGGRRYTVCEISMTDCDTDETEFVRSKIPVTAADDVLRIVLRGESSGTVNADTLSDAAFYVTVRDKTHPRRELWDGIDDGTLRGVFLRLMREKYDSGDESAVNAVRYGLAAMDSREDFSL